MSGRPRLDSAVAARTLRAARPFCALGALLVLGCQAAPSDLRPWKPSDHTNVGESSGATLPRPGKANPNNPTNQVSGETKSNTPRGLEEVTIASWRSNCATCHGAMGRGDGPQAPMFTPRDLTEPAWQASVSDEQLFTSIQKGKNKMPGFSLPDQVAHNLVALVRLLNRERLGQPASGAASAPASSAAGASTAPTSATAQTNPAQTNPAQRTAPSSAATAGKPGGAPAASGK